MFSEYPEVKLEISNKWNIWNYTNKSALNSIFFNNGCMKYQIMKIEQMKIKAIKEKIHKYLQDNKTKMVV